MKKILSNVNNFNEYIEERSKAHLDRKAQHKMFKRISKKLFNGTVKPGTFERTNYQNPALDKLKYSKGTWYCEPEDYDDLVEFFKELVVIY